MAFNLTVQEAAQRLGVSPARVYQLVNGGSLAAERIGRTWVLDEDAVMARAAAAPHAGRPRKGNAGGRPESYMLMSRSHEIVEFSYDRAAGRFSVSSDVIDAARAPLGIVSPRGKRITGQALSYWWKHRAIPATREGLAARLLELGVPETAALPFESLGLSLSDQYWVRPEGADIGWADVNFFTNEFAFEAHGGEWVARTGLDSPDNTSEGELPKRWVVDHGIRTLVKGSSALGQEPYNEVVATELFDRLLRPDDFVPYRLVEANGAPASACSCFLHDDEEYIPAYYVRKIMRKPNHLNEYRHYIECCARLGVEDAESRLSQMIVCDDILANHDRHWRNFGIVRNVETLACRTAPLFDTGSCLWCDTPTAALATGIRSFTTKPFYADANRQLRLVDDYSWFDEDALEGFPAFVERTLQENPDLARRAPLIRQGIEARIDRILRGLR